MKHHLNTLFIRDRRPVSPRGQTVRVRVEGEVKAHTHPHPGRHRVLWSCQRQHALLTVRRAGCGRLLSRPRAACRPA